MILFLCMNHENIHKMALTTKKMFLVYGYVFVVFICILINKYLDKVVCYTPDWTIHKVKNLTNIIYFGESSYTSNSDS